jgi:hypothetical protein
MDDALVVGDGQRVSDGDAESEDPASGGDSDRAPGLSLSRRPPCR